MSTRPSLYSAFWRWHFYAGLLTLPVLVSLAVTGGLYLFKDEITAAVYRDVVSVEARDGRTLEPSAIVEIAEETTGGRAIGFLPPATPESSARVYVDAGSRGERDVFIDPFSGALLGDLQKGEYGNLPLMHMVRNFHSLQVMGWPGNRLVEIVAGWTLILIVTGIYLWWPRGQRGGVVTIRRASGKRMFWRDLHAVTGIFAGGIILFLVVTGLPWSGVWGAGLQSAVNSAGWGYPAGFWFPVAESSMPLRDVVTPTPWVLENAPVPVSAVDSSGAAMDIGVDRAVAIIDRLGIHPGYTLMFPNGEAGVYTASVIPEKVAGARAIHLDRFSGDILFDASYADLGLAARVIELGTSIHVGEEFGRANQWLMLLGCIAIVAMSVAAVMMWWARRPAGRLGAPPYRHDRAVPGFVWTVAIGLGILFPLVGLSMLAVIATDLAIPARWRERLE